ncbi:hypothetical protein ERJ75_001237700 [Trypanosoma vivax]|nr:hypothetical protein TRVL_06064 [Trypanosoma vivax]KAH8609165.1 hypothetical protein ERJ75_001237700 [Trypanosoma vivax]
MELHIFDFDGTIFNSPVPSVRLRRVHGAKIFGELMRPLADKGAGWFQSLSTLSPPAVPRKPEVKEWYVLSTLDKLKVLEEQKGTPVEPGCPSPVDVCVLTGRDEKFRGRIEEILDNAGLLSVVSKLFLKPHETYGTVKYKLEVFTALITEKRPRHVYYYEDRVDQGMKLLEGVRLLFSAANRDNSSGVSIFVGMVDSNGALRPFVPEAVSGNRAENDLCGPVKHWWGATCRQFDSDFSGLLPFSFTLVLIDPSSCLRCEQMLSAEEEDALVAQLMSERDSYRASNPRISSGSRGPFRREAGHRK